MGTTISCSAAASVVVHVATLKQQSSCDIIAFKMPARTRDDHQTIGRRTNCGEINS